MASNDVFIPGSPSVSERLEMLQNRGVLGPGSQLDDNRALPLPPLPPRGSKDLDVNKEVRKTNPDISLGAIQKPTNSQSSVNLLYTVAHLIRESISDSMGRSKRRGRRPRRTGSLLLSRSVLKETGRLQEQPYRLH